MTSYPEETILTSCRVFMDLGFALCHADGTLQKAEGQTLAEELKRLLTSLGAPSTIRAQVPAMLATASGKFGKGATAKARDTAIGDAITTGKTLPEDVRNTILAALDQIAGSDGDHDSAEAELTDRVRAAWIAAEAFASTAPGTTGSEAGAESDADRFLAAAVHVFMVYLHVPNDPEDAAIQEAQQIAERVASTLGMSPEDPATSTRLSEHFLEASFVAGSDFDTQSASFGDNIARLATAPDDVQRVVLSGVLGLMPHVRNPNSDSLSLLQIATLGLVTGSGAESTDDTPTATLPSADTLRALQSYLDENDTLLDFWWLPDPGRDSRVKPTYGWVVGRPVAFMQDETGFQSLFLSWDLINQITYENLTGDEEFTIDGVTSLRRFCEEDNDIFTAIYFGENQLRGVTLQCENDEPGTKPGFASALALLGLSHSASNVEPGVHEDRATIIDDSFKGSMDHMVPFPLVRRIVHNGAVRAIIVAISLRMDEGNTTTGVPRDAEDAVMAIVATDAHPSEMAHLELFASMYERMQRKCVVPFRHLPMVPTPRATHSFRSLSQWCEADVDALPDYPDSIPAAQMKQLQQDLHDAALSLRYCDEECGSSDDGGHQEPSPTFETDTSGATHRPIHPPTGCPLLHEEELESLSRYAQQVALHWPPLCRETAARWLTSMDGVGHPMRFDFLSEGMLREMFAASGEPEGPILGVVPRVWLLRLAEAKFDVFPPLGKEFHFHPTVLIASCQRLNWQVEGAWQSIPYVAGTLTDEPDDDDTEDHMPRWSEVFGRGPFAEFSHSDIGLEPSEGNAGYMDLFLGTRANVTQTPYGQPGAPCTRVGFFQPPEAREAHDAAGTLEAALESANSRMRSALRLVIEAFEDPDTVIPDRGLMEDLARMSAFLMPMYVQGGFHAFMPRGLDPHGMESFRSPTVVHTTSDPEEADPCGRPLRAHARRGVTVPLFIEPTGTDGGSYLSILTASLRNAWPAIQAGGDSDSICRSERHRLAEFADLEGQKLEDAERASAPERAARESRSKMRMERRKALDAALEQSDKQEAVRAIVDRDEMNADAWRILSTLCRFDDQFDEALRAAEKSVEIDPTARSHWVCAKAHHALGDEEATNRSLHAALTCWDDPNDLVHTWSAVSLWEALERHGSIGDALEVLTDAQIEEALRLNQSTPEDGHNDVLLRFMQALRRHDLQWLISTMQSLLTDTLDRGWLTEHPDLMPWPLTDFWLNYAKLAKESEPLNDDEKRVLLEKARPAFTGALEAQFAELRAVVEEQ